MEYRRLGSSGLRVSALSLGGWLTFGERVDQPTTDAIITAAVDRGVNFIDLADSYGRGKAELAVGSTIKTVGLQRSSLVISSKVFWPQSDDPNDRGLSRKHIMESVDRSLKRLGTDYLDMYFCHRFDEETPLEETMRAMDDLVHRGKVLYWGTSVWPAKELTRAHQLSGSHGWYAPVVEQPCYNLLSRDIEREVAPAASKLGMGLVVWSPLAGGLLTGKYAGGVPAGSRAVTESRFLKEEQIRASAEQVRVLIELAGKLNCTPAQLAVAWLLRRPFVSSVILGATSVDQLIQNLGALDVKLTDDADATLSSTFPGPGGAAQSLRRVLGR